MRYFLFALSVLFIVGCNNQNTPEVTGGADGELWNLQDSSVQITAYLSPLSWVKGKQPNFQETIEVDSNGIFIYPHHFEEGYYFFEYDGNRLKYFIAEGKKLSIDLDASKPTEKPDYSGKMKYESRYLFDKHHVLANYVANKEAYYELPQEQFLDVVDQLRGKLDTMLVLYITNRPVGSKLFMEQESLSNFYYLANEMVSYKLRSEEQGITLTGDFDSLLNKVNLIDQRAMDNSDYFQFLTSSLWNMSAEPIDLSSAEEAMKLADSNLFSSDLRDYFFYQIANRVCEWERGDDQDLILDSILMELRSDSIRSFTLAKVQLDTVTTITADSIAL